MASRTEQFLAGYFRLLALTCSARKRSVQRLLSSYLALVLGDMVIQLWRYFVNGWHLNELHKQRQQQFNAYARIIDAMGVAYLLAHMLMVLQALLLRNRERRLLAQLPAIGEPSSGLINIRLHMTLECIIIGCALTITVFQSIQGQQLLPNLREFYTTQAVRARYLQMALLVVRLDVQLVALQEQLVNGRRSSLELRSSYAHIVRLARQLSRLYGLSVLMMNVLCIGDFIVVCYAYIILWQLTTMNLSWVLLCQTIYVVLPTIIKIWTLCDVCDSCAKRVSFLPNLCLSIIHSKHLSLSLSSVPSRRSCWRSSTALGARSKQQPKPEPKPEPEPDPEPEQDSLASKPKNFRYILCRIWCSSRSAASTF